MTRSRFLFFVVSLLLSSSLLAAIKPPTDKEKWLEVTSGEFRIFSNASARETRRIVSDLVSMREALAVATKLKVRGSVPVNVFIFRDDRAFAPYRDGLLNQKNANIAGLFLDDADAKFVILNAATPDSERVVYHELTHYFVRNTATNLPPWFHEGIAEYYSTFAVSRDEVEIGRPVTEHVHWLRDQPLIPFEKLFAMDALSREYSERSRQGVFYAQSWALLHYMLVADNGARRHRVGKFLELLERGRPTDEAFTTAFQTTYAEMEKALSVYVRRPMMQYVRYKIGELKMPEIAEPQPASRAEVLAALGSLLASSVSTLADAEAFLHEATRVDPQSGAAYAALGDVKMRMRDQTSAMAAYEKALAVGSADANVHIAYGSALLGAEVRTEGDVKRAREFFTTASRLDPTSARALAGLGATFVGTDEDPAPGIAALEKSLKLAPSQEDVAMNLVQLYAAAGRREDAQRIVDTVLSRSSDANMVSAAAEAVLSADLVTADKLMQRGKAAEALALLERVKGETKSASMQMHIDSLISHARLAVQVDRVNVAIDVANKGRLTEAIKILDEVVPQMTNEEFKKRAEELRAQFKKRRGK